jgi:hypothetical protein
MDESSVSDHTSPALSAEHDVVHVLVDAIYTLSAGPWASHPKSELFRLSFLQVLRQRVGQGNKQSDRQSDGMRLIIPVFPLYGLLTFTI